MRVVKSYVREDYEKKKFAAAAEDVCKDFTRAERIMALNNPMMQFCVYAGMVFVLSFGSYAVITSQRHWRSPWARCPPSLPTASRF